MERLRNIGNNCYRRRIFAAGLAAGAFALAFPEAGQAMTAPDEGLSSGPSIVLTFTDGTKCVDGIYESAAGMILDLEGSCEKNTNVVHVSVSNNVGPANGFIVDNTQETYSSSQLARCE